MKGDILVTGGAGYIGAHVCKALAQAGFSPIVYDNLGIGHRSAVRWGPLEIGDILDPVRLDEVMARYRPIGVMHFAALALVGELMVDPALYYRANVTGLLNVLDSCRQHGTAAFVFSSSCAVYGVPATVPIDERQPKDPVNPYGASKLMAERVLADYGMAYGLRSACLRYFNAAGADPDGELGEQRAVETHLVPLALDAVLGTRPPLRIMGVDYPTPDGTAIRDYVHVTDLAQAHVVALTRLLDGAASSALNLATGRGHSVREVLDMVQRVSGRSVPAETAPRRPGDPPVLVADPTRARAELGVDFAYSASLEHIVETAWAWRRKMDLARAA